MRETCRAPTPLVCTGVFLFCLCGAAVHAAEPALQQQVEQLRLQNERLQRQMQQQQEVIDRLSRKVGELDSASKATSQTEMRATEMNDDRAASPKAPRPFGLGKLNLSGEGGLAFFQSQSQGPFPKAEFRIDVAKLLLE